MSVSRFPDPVTVISYRGGANTSRKSASAVLTSLDGYRCGGFGKEAVKMGFNRVSAGRHLLKTVTSIILAGV